MAGKTQNRGLVKRGKDDTAVIDLPLPGLRDDYILVKTIAVALNPADWQDLGEDFTPGSKPLLMGCDYSGIVEAVGPKVAKNLKVGDRVMGSTHGTNETNPEDGGFAQHIVAKGDITIRIPSYMSFGDASTLPSGVLTTGLAFYSHLGLPLLPATVSAGTWLLVYGGSSAMGSIAIQFAKLSGLKVATACSPRNFDLVRERGADVVFDYRDPECARKINHLTANNLTLVYDTIGTSETAQVCANAMSSKEGGTYCCLMDVPSPRQDVKSIFFLGYTGLGEAYLFDGKEWPIVPKDYELVKRFAILAESLLEDKKIIPHPAEVRSGGLEKIKDGLDDLKEKRVSGKKLVYIIGEE